MTTLIDEVAEAIRQMLGANMRELSGCRMPVYTAQDMAEAAIEAYERRLLSDECVEAAIVGDAKCDGCLFESQRAAIKAAIEKAKGDD